MSAELTASVVDLGEAWRKSPEKRGGVGEGEIRGSPERGRKTRGRETESEGLRAGMKKLAPPRRRRRERGVRMCW